MKIAFVYDEVAYGAHRPPINWQDPDSGGLTGTDLVCVKYAEAIAKRGHEVTVFCYGGKPAAGNYQQANGYLVTGLEALDRTDLSSFGSAIAISCPNELRRFPNTTLRMVNRQVARFDGPELPPDFDDFVDVYLCPSQTAAEYVSKGMPHPEKFAVLPNGCEPEAFDGHRPKVPGRVVYCSSPDRGLHLLLSVWPAIKARVPEANLKIFYYSLDSWLAFHCDPANLYPSPAGRECARRAQYIAHALPRLTSLGVEKVGGVSHREIQRELALAKVFAYPVDTLAFTETFSVATLEACAARALPVIAACDAIGQIYGDAVEVIEHPVRDRLDLFTAAVVAGLTDDTAYETDRARAFAKTHTWERLTDRLEAIVNDRRAAPTVSVADRVWGHLSAGFENTIADAFGGGGSEPKRMVPRDMPALVGSQAGYAGPSDVVRKEPEPMIGTVTSPWGSITVDEAGIRMKPPSDAYEGKASSSPLITRRASRDPYEYCTSRRTVPCAEREGGRLFSADVFEDHADAMCEDCARQRYGNGRIDAIPPPQEAYEGKVPFRVTMGQSAPPPNARAMIRPRVHLVLSPYASGNIEIDLDDDLNDNHGGGCRAGFLGLVRALGKLGTFDVTAFSTFKKTWTTPKDAHIQGVTYKPWSDFSKAEPRDALLAYYDTSPLIGTTRCLRIASHHTFMLPFPNANEWADVNVAPSQYACDALSKVYDQRAPWYVLPNAVGDMPILRSPVKGRVIYHTSPSRGLHKLLEMWPRILMLEPEATLHVVGDVDGWLKDFRGRECRQGIAARRLQDAIDRLTIDRAIGTVKFLGRLPRRALLRELGEASVFAFPCETIMPCETFSVSIMECLKIGLPVVLMPADALESVYAGHAFMANDEGDFVTNVLSIMQIDNRRAAIVAAGKAFASQFTFERSAAALADVLTKHLDQRAGVALDA